ncbi:MAG: hypothetical protein K5985_06520 [Lachnospiraceae bacterium]|nr:hypothetical protein [Lachnospiraceae bacterium]
MAVCILAVAVIPMLRSFISSAYLNRKARDRLSAMMVAEDIVEGLKGHSFEDTKKAFEDFEKTPSTEDFQLLAKDIVKADTRMKVVSADGILHISVNNLHARTTDETADRVYDATISINALEYRDGGGSTVSYNSQPLSLVRNMSNVYDGVFLYNYPKDWLDVQDIVFKEHEDAYDNPDEVPMADVSKYYKVNIEKSGTNEKRVSANVVVNYYYTGGGAAINPADPVFSKTYGVYDNIDTYEKGGTLKNLFFFYFPGYEFKSAAFNDTGNIGGTAHDDTIIINNKDDIPVSFYIVKQIRYDAAQLYSDELTYSPVVYINEGSSAEIVTDVCSNLNVNLADGSKLDNMEMNRDTVFIYSPGSKAKPADYNPFKGLTEAPMDRIFDVKVDIFRRNKNFDPDSRVAHLDSSTID